MAFHFVWQLMYLKEQLVSRIRIKWEPRKCPSQGICSISERGDYGPQQICMKPMLLCRYLVISFLLTVHGV